ncbi:MAG: EAL domain-containing protein [Parvularculaceae bacterium]
MVAQAVRLSNLDIDNALKNKDFEVLFQPIFDLGNGALARVESFIRWRHPTLGVLPPGAFISVFETQGRMSELTRYVLSEALGAYQGWRGSFAPGFSINLALSDLSDESFPSHFSLLTRNAGFPVELVTLECPMPAVDADMASISRQLQRLAATGARLAIEVRGRATDFLHTVDPFPFAEIKTGGAAILRFARTVRGPGLSAISELLELAVKKNAAITAVGVEDQASLSALKGLGFAAAQGNHLGKVGPLNQFLPSHVNTVRANLGLEPLSSDDLAALFRTGAPIFAAQTPAAATPNAAATAQASVAEDVAGDARDIGASDIGSSEFGVNDISANDFSSGDVRSDDLNSNSAGSKDGAASPADREDQEKIIERLAARLARTEAPSPSPEQPPTAADAKAAAITRARQRTIARDRINARNALRDKAEQQDAGAGAQAAARDMQDRLSREFEAFVDETPDTPAAEAHAADTRAETSAPQSLPGDGKAGETAAYAAAALPPDEPADPPPTAVAAPRPSPGQSSSPRLSPRIVRTQMPVNGAGARFVQTLRVSGAEGVTPIAPGPARMERAQTPLPQNMAADALAPEPAPQAAAVEDTLDQEIPATGPSTEWVEETVAVAANFAPRRPRRRRRKIKNILGIPYTGYFWPRWAREWAADRRALREARTLED